LSLREVLDVFGRRWMLSVAVLLLALGGGWLVAHPKPKYKAIEVFTVQPPVSPQVPNQLNSFRPSLAITAAVVAQRLKTPAGEAKLRTRGVVGDYDVVPRNSGTVQTPAYIIPSLQATATTFDQSSALRSVVLLARAFSDELTAMQDELDVAAAQRIVVSEVAPASVVVQLPSRSRALLGVGLLGTAGAVLVPLWYEQALRRRATPRSGARPRGRRRRSRVRSATSEPIQSS
jgi:hypothetical protein